jgi:hypothetical protein
LLKRPHKDISPESSGLRLIIGSVTFCSYYRKKEDAKNMKKTASTASKEEGASVDEFLQRQTNDKAILPALVN